MAGRNVNTQKQNKGRNKKKKTNRFKQFFTRKPSYSDEIGSRIRDITVLLVAVCMGICVLKLAYLQIVQGTDYQEKARIQQMSDQEIVPLRGTIYDTNGIVLAESTYAWKVTLDPKTLYDTTYFDNGLTSAEKEEKYDHDRKIVTEKLSEILDLDREKLYEYTGKEDNHSIQLNRTVDMSTKKKIQNILDKNDVVNCVSYERTTMRNYPNGTLASKILGYTGTDRGLYGLEASYDDILSGTAGRTITKNVSDTSVEISNFSKYNTIDGNGLVLTINSDIQQVLEDELEKTYVNSNAVGAYGIVMQVKTGAILALSDKPDFDPNEPYEPSYGALSAAEVFIEENYSEEEAKKIDRVNIAQTLQWKINPITTTYEPGSTFKCITLAMGLDTGIADKDGTSFYCGGQIPVDTNIVECDSGTAHGQQDLRHALMNSCNVFFVQLGQKIGAKRFMEYFKAFGFTEKTGVDLPGEMEPTYNLYHREDKFGYAEASSYAFGQSFQISPLQLITAVSCIANGGKLMKPYVVDKILDHDGNIIKITEPEVRRQVISEQTSKTVLDMMESVVIEGTGVNGRVEGYNVAGKTGSAEKLIKVTRKAEEHGSDTENEKIVMASFVSVAPGDDPEVAVLIVLDEPTNDLHGGSVAAPVASAVMEAAMTALGIEPKYGEDSKAIRSVDVPDVIGKNIYAAGQEIIDAGLNYKHVGSGTEVVRQTPAGTLTLPKSGTVILYTDDSETQTVFVPDFSGMTLAGAISTAQSMGISVQPAGNYTSGYTNFAYSQSVPVGQEVPLGTVVKVRFRSR